MDRPPKTKNDALKIPGRVVIAGGSGFLGMNLARHLLASGTPVTVLSRGTPRGEGAWDHARWDGRTLDEWAGSLDGAAALVNLAGRSVDCVKTPAQREEILRSRVDSTEVLGQALRHVKAPPPVWVQMSTAHIYGDPPRGILCDEDAELGQGFAPDIGRAWETAYAHSVLPTTRQVIVRTSFVLGRDGGALQRLATLARWGLGGAVGHGEQGISWLHEEDMNRLFVRAIVEAGMEGIYIATAPNPVSNREFMREVRRALDKRIGLPAAGWMVRLAAPLLLKTDPELALYGRYCVSKRLEEEGFEFSFPELAPALENLLGPA